MSERRIDAILWALFIGACIAVAVMLWKGYA